MSLSREDKTNNEADAGSNERGLGRVATDASFEALVDILDAGADVLDGEAPNGLRQISDISPQCREFVA
jgi:hypothetical protein